MKKILIIFILLITINLFSAEFMVKDFKEHPMDIELQKNPVRDVNGEYAALIKINTDLMPFTFNTNIGVVQTVKKVGEFWAYVPSGTSQLIFSKEGFILKRYPIPITIESNVVYSMTLQSQTMYANLTIKSNPYESKGAEIYLNNTKQKKTTPAVFELLFGKYNVTLKHPKFIEQTQSIMLKENEQRSLIFDMETYKGSMLSKADKWKRTKWISLISSCLLAGGGIYCNSVGDKYLDDYDKSTTNADAVSNRDSFEKYYNYRDTAYYVSIGPLVYGLYSWINQLRYEKLAKSRK